MPTTILASTSITSWTVPADWSNTSNTIGTIGGGGGGTNGVSSAAGGGGGGGAFSRISNLALTPGASITVSIGSAGVGGTTPTVGGDTWFNGATLAAASVGSKGGAGAGALAAGVSAGGIGGASASGVGTVRNSGGNGAGTNASIGGGGGGAGGGFNGIGGSGGTTDAVAQAGGGGGGANGGTAGSSANGSTGGSGGNNFDGVGGGAGGASGNPGSAGSLGGGGGGGGNSERGGAGGAGPSIGVSAGVGGGGGGAGGDFFGDGDGGAGGNYGGGGGGAALGNTANSGGNGATGAIVIAYNPDLGWQFLPALPNRRNHKKTLALIASGLAFTAPVIAVATEAEMAWRQWWSEPVRAKRGLKNYLQQSFIHAIPQNLLPEEMRWFGSLSSPVMLPKALRADLQNYFTAPPRLLPTPNVTALMAATEINSDIAMINANVYIPGPTPADPYAKVSINEISIERSAAASIQES